MPSTCSPAWSIGAAAAQSDDGQGGRGIVAAFHAELNAQRAARTAGRAAQERELADVRRKLDGLIDAIAEGMRAPGLQQRLDELEARRAALEQALSDEAPPPVRMHPNLAQACREKVEQLQEALTKPEDRDEATLMLRRLIERVIVRQAEEGLQIELVGEIVRLIELGLDGKRAAFSAEEVCSVKVVAGACNHLCRTIIAWTRSYGSVYNQQKKRSLG